MSLLVPMRPESYSVFFDLASAWYAGETAQAGRWTPDEAPALARQEMERLLPQGAATPDHHLLEILESEAGPTVGFIWYARAKRGSADVAFVYQVLVLPEARRRGHARAALVEVERRAREQGMASIALHVFAHNRGARALYESIGYTAASLNLHKPLAGRAG